MIELAYIARPLIGAVIGYITNDIAIRMLFRPRTAKYLFGVKIPFTPGLIPKEKARIASSIGDAVSKNLMNRDVLERTLLSEGMLAKISRGLNDFITAQKGNDESVESFLRRYLSRSEIESIRANVSSDLSRQIHSALASAELGTKISHIVVEHVITKIRGGMLGVFGADQFIGLIAAPVESLLAKNIDEMLACHSQEMVGSLINNQVENFLKLPVKELLVGKDRQIEQAEKTILSLYKTLVTQHLPKVLETINISKIIESRINEMDVRETERLILEVMNRELRAIVWLGALLGFLMGCVNLLF